MYVLAKLGVGVRFFPSNWAKFSKKPHCSNSHLLLFLLTADLPWGFQNSHLCVFKDVTDFPCDSHFRSTALLTDLEASFDNERQGGKLIQEKMLLIKISTLNIENKQTSKTFLTGVIVLRHILQTYKILNNYTTMRKLHLRVLQVQ